MASTTRETIGDRLTRRAHISMIILGGLLVAVGVVALVAAFSATLASVAVMGALLVAAGIVEIVEAFIDRRSHRLLSNLFAGVIYGVVGLLILLHPSVTAAVLTAMLATLFFTLGIMRVVGALALRYDKWGWSILSGVASAVLGIIVFANWPISAVWLIGTLIGVEFIFVGVHLIGMGTALPVVVEEVRREARMPARPPPEQRPPPPS
jgi:uncharacterized membrane protein HdeD (DUF308 family)